MLCTHVVEVRHQQGLDCRGQHRDSILAPLAVADHDLVRREIDVFHAQPAALQQAEAGAVEKKRHDPRHAGQLLQDRPGLLAGEDHGQVLGTLGPHDIVEPRRSTPSTSRYRKSRALSAWFCVEAATLSRTASEDRNAEISAGPISAGCRLSWKKMNRRIQWT
jgi:hypothetical protein